MDTRDVEEKERERFERCLSFCFLHVSTYEHKIGFRHLGIMSYLIQ